MTLVARVRPPAYHKKVSGKHHRQSKTYHKTYWPYLPLLAIVVVGVLANSFLPGRASVLGYATDMSIQSLLDDTNAQRLDNNEGSLTLNQQLNSAAQAKASDMSARNYWSHNTPDGKTPWTFITASGYSYRLAGENLAYGFATASDTLTGWMNSPGHRANILNAGYTEVGFGYINITNYQKNGPETLVVAMYAAPAAVANPTPAAVTAPKSPTKPASSRPVAASTVRPADANQPADTPAAPAEPSSPTAAPTQTAVVTPQTSTAAAKQPQAHSISRIQLLTAGKAPQSLAILSVVGIAALLIFLFRHALAWHKIFVKGEQFLLHHPLLDVVLVGIITLAFVLARGSGVVR